MQTLQRQMAELRTAWREFLHSLRRPQAKAVPGEQIDFVMRDDSRMATMVVTQVNWHPDSITIELQDKSSLERRNRWPG